jgi:predicted nucleic acid-binding protein
MIAGKAILLDSCIINYGLSKQKDLADKTNSFLDGLLLANNRFYISQFTPFEILKGIDERKKPQAESLLQNFGSVPQTQERIERATRLYSAYCKEPALKSYINAISDIDVLIGALIFTEHEPYLLTADFNDFPRPFFQEVGSQRIDYQKENGQRAGIYYYFLKANLGAL